MDARGVVPAIFLLWPLSGAVCFHCSSSSADIGIADDLITSFGRCCFCLALLAFVWSPHRQHRRSKISFSAVKSPVAALVSFLIAALVPSYSLTTEDRRRWPPAVAATSVRTASLSIYRLWDQAKRQPGTKHSSSVGRKLWSDKRRIEVSDEENGRSLSFPGPVQLSMNNGGSQLVPPSDLVA